VLQRKQNKGRRKEVDGIKDGSYNLTKSNEVNEKRRAGEKKSGGGGGV